MSVRRVATIGMVIGLCACTAAGVDKNPNPLQGGKVQTLWPAPPDQPRFEFETTLRSGTDIVRESEEMKWRKVLTGRGLSDDPVIYKPSGIVARSGLIYIAEPAAKRVTVFDVPRRKLFSIGRRAPNQLDKPMSLALDARQHLYVLDSGLRKVMIFDKFGLFAYSISLNQGFTYPVAAVPSPDGETIYVVDRGDVENDDHKVVAFGRDGKERFRLGPRGQDPGKFNIPLAAATGADGALYVVDSGNFRVQKFDERGKFLSTFGGNGAELGRFSRPRAITLDAQGNIYVSDSGFGNVQIFDPQGRLLMPLGSMSRLPAPGNFQLIAGITVDETGRLYVIDHYARKIEVFRRLSDDDGQRRMRSRE